MSRQKLWTDLLIVTLLLVLTSAQSYAVELTGKVVWSGEVNLNELVVVMPKAMLVIEPGTRVVAANAQVKISVRGKIEALGTAENPIVFKGEKGWLGVEFMEAQAGSRLQWVELSSSAAAISSFSSDFEVDNCTFNNNEFGVRLLRESGPLITNSSFEGNKIGIANEMKSSAVIRENRFAHHEQTAVLSSHNSRGTIAGNMFDNNKQGVTLLQRFPGLVAKNTFKGNEIGVYCNQTQNTPLIEENLFEENESGILNFSFAFPAIKNNSFVRNKTAVHNDQYGSPLVENNLFKSNETALYNYRKSNPKVHLNSFEENELALFCDFSAYPEIKNNNFLGNSLGVKLGIYQSADWEKRSGSKPIMQREALARQSQNPLLSQAPDSFNDFVDVSGNWWGDDTASLEKVGDGNSELFYDRHDLPEVTYEGYGPGVYRLDRVEFTPWLQDPVAGVGPMEQ